MFSALLQHGGVMVAAGLLGAATLVLTLVGVLMARAGLSLRPIWWFAGLFLIVVLPQLAFHVYDALRQPRAGSSYSRGPADAGEAASHEALGIDRRFGDDVDPSMIADVRPAFAEIFADAEEVRFAAISADETVLLARFPNARAAEKGWIAYLAASGLRDVVSGDSERGFTGNFAGGGRVFVLPMGRMVGVWVGPDDDAIRARMAKGNFAPPRNAGLTGAAAAGQPGPAIPMPLQMGGLLGLVLLTSLYFFKGASWAAGAPAAAVTPLPPDQLRTRLLAINELDVPFRVTNRDDGTVEVTWRYADAKWLDFARAHGMRRTHRVVLRLDEGAHVARVSDFAANIDWSAGAGGGSLRWQGSTGITFFQYRHERVYGLQLGPDGRLTPNLSYSYTFNLQEMKEPLIRVITESGWEWRPVLWSSSPSWLRWFTE